MRTRVRGTLLLLVGAALSGCLATSTQSALSNGKPAPETTGVDADGNRFALADYRGKVVLLDFWANY
jgi:cytochrome oxidase Cu insertion factor (SCO1/SenC/PrrC family)